MSQPSPSWKRDREAMTPHYWDFQNLNRDAVVPPIFTSSYRTPTRPEEDASYLGIKPQLKMGLVLSEHWTPSCPEGLHYPGLDVPPLVVLS